jgi:hypothetical protein
MYEAIYQHLTGKQQFDGVWITKNVQPLQHHDNQAAIIALFRVINSYVGNLPPMPGVFPDYPIPVCVIRTPGGANQDALGHAAAAHRRPASHQRPQHVRHRAGSVGLKPENQCRHLTFCASELFVGEASGDWPLR